MKIAVYTIALNEEQFVQRWAESCKEADYRFILDTGSTDKTLHEIILNDTINWEQKKFTPWRFDHARNAALSMLPQDIDMCIALDMDEVLQPGWRQALENLEPGTTRPRYKYIWSWNPDGSEGLVYGGDKIHRRHGFEWKHPVHEVLKSKTTEIQQWTPGLEIHHYPDNSKSRSQYLPLLKLAVEEDPKDDRNQFYLARELFFAGDYDLSKYHFGRHLDLSVWNPERAASYRYLAKMVPETTESYLYRAIAEDPYRRESWVDLAQYYYGKQNWLACRDTASRALAIKEKPLDYLCEAEAWGWLPHDLMAIASYHLGDKATAWHHGGEAVRLNMNDNRLRNNLEWYNIWA
jgi:glycosyltransferase involved in cell wall biosynthesis